MQPHDYTLFSSQKINSSFLFSKAAASLVKDVSQKGNFWPSNELFGVSIQQNAIFK